MVMEKVLEMEMEKELEMGLGRVWDLHADQASSNRVCSCCHLEDSLLSSTNGFQHVGTALWQTRCGRKRFNQCARQPTYSATT